MKRICYNGNFIGIDDPAADVSKTLQTGNGIFETMKWNQGSLALGNFHFDRLYKGLSWLNFITPVSFTKEKLLHQIGQLTKNNICEELARIRLSVWKEEKDEVFNYLVESWPLETSVNRLNNPGLRIGIVPGVKRECSEFSNLKMLRREDYIMAGNYAKENDWDDALLLNEQENIADSTIANVFIIKDGTIKTPSLDQGCVEGVMRRYLLERMRGTEYGVRDAGYGMRDAGYEMRDAGHGMRDAGYGIREESISGKDLEEADEVFLSNAIRGIRWVSQFGNKTYSNRITSEIFKKFLQTIPPAYCLPPE